MHKCSIAYYLHVVMPLYRFILIGSLRPSYNSRIMWWIKICSRQRILWRPNFVMGNEFYEKLNSVWTAKFYSVFFLHRDILKKIAELLKDLKSCLAPKYLLRDSRWVVRILVLAKGYIWGAARSFIRFLKLTCWH